MLVRSLRYARTAWFLFRARRWLVATLSPFVERSRFIERRPDEQWAGAYRVGFLSTLITRLALRRFPAVGGDTLGLIHAETWHALLPDCPCPIGERTLGLSLADDAEFLEGCEAAFRFEACLWNDHDPGLGDALGQTPPTDELGNARVSSTDRWASAWDACLTRSHPTIA